MNIPIETGEEQRYVRWGTGVKITEETRQHPL